MLLVLRLLLLLLVLVLRLLLLPLVLRLLHLRLLLRLHLCVLLLLLHVLLRLLLLLGRAGAGGRRRLARLHLLEARQAVDLDLVARRQEGVELEDQILRGGRAR